MYTIPLFEDIRAAYLRDIKNLLPDAATDVDSDFYIRATALASAIDGLYHHQLWTARQVLPDTSDPEYLERHAALRGITRKPAVAASGELTVQGTPGAVIPSGESVRHTATSLTFLTAEQGIIGANGQAKIAVQASQPGIMPAFSGEPVLFTQAPAGIQSEAGLTLSGGIAAETDAELLARLLEYMQHPPGGGNIYDYKRWVMAVPGISKAWAYPNRRGLGTVDVAVLGPDGQASAQAIAEAQAKVDANRPAACKDAWVLSPTPLLVNVNVAVRLDATITTLATFTAQLQEGLASIFKDLPPGGVVYRSKIEAVTSSLPGVIDRQVKVPQSNYVALVNAQRLEWPRLGLVQAEAL
ncbi:MAG: baseplate J/gp47 family protein [Desulfovibrio sp.]|nr:baseplate J/gp47 family protein [Desulfovibrio sp.]MBI4960423.1 baseplate J/gp47 family protein [Desulfovibrio sp.]